LGRSAVSHLGSRGTETKPQPAKNIEIESAYSSCESGNLNGQDLQIHRAHGFSFKLKKFWRDISDLARTSL
jgi:hypothetical protein